MAKKRQDKSQATLLSFNNHVNGSNGNAKLAGRNINGIISLSELEQYLWGAANILRGPVDKADFKSYIFPLLFFKRISDVYDEEYQQALNESGGDQEYASFPEQHKFIIPEGAHWRNVREKTENVGQAIHF